MSETSALELVIAVQDDVHAWLLAALGREPTWQELRDVPRAALPAQLRERLNRVSEAIERECGVRP